VEGCPIVTAGNAAIPRHALLACEPFSPRLGAGGVAAALSAGLAAGGAPEPESLELPADADDRATAAVLEREDFHRRMHAARAVVIAVPSLAERTLDGSAAFEIATLARQSGVPCYAVAATVELNEFDLRILDLQLVLKARGAGTLRAAGERLAEVI
jgi:glycerate kinase